MTLQHDIFDLFGRSLEGEWHPDPLWRSIYATDASVYRELPLAVALPKNEADLKKLIHFASQHQLSLVPRAGGTSLAGQCVGNGIVVDVSRFMNKILDFNAEERWVKVQPGVIRDDLNRFLKPHGLFFSPVTSTSNRAMIGGMVGNNSSGQTSIEYGSTREHVLAIRALLSDGSEVIFENLDATVFAEKLQQDDMEGQLYRQIQEMLDNPANRNSIEKEFPKKSIHRRNTGYALDMLLDRQPFSPDGAAFNFCSLICGSEGTLALATEITLSLDPLPLPEEVIVCLHFSDVLQSMRATGIAMQMAPSACELMDKVILDCTKSNLEQAKNRFFIEGDPVTLLMVEFRANKIAEAEARAAELISRVKEAGLGYAYPIVRAPHTEKVWELRKAGLGVMGNLPGDPKGVACIEDTAVAVEDLPDYIAEIEELGKKYNQQMVYYAHAGAGEIHVRPILNMKTAADQQVFYDITRETAELVKKYGGSMSGEHGDGRVRSEFIPLVLGEENYALLKQVKQTWDPQNIFNPGKIVDPVPMKSAFRYEAGQETPEWDTVMDFSPEGGYLRMVEKCNGVGACRKTPDSGGTMCPSYMATRQEKDTTRGRANALREFLSGNKPQNPFDHEEVFEALKYCLSCKGCTNECPSSVDMSSLKAEFTHQYYQSHRRPLSDLAFGNIGRLGKLASLVPGLANFPLRQPLVAGFVKRVLGVARERSIPAFAKTTVREWYRRYYSEWAPAANPKGEIYLFCDEFTNYQDAEIGIKAVQLLTKLGYRVELTNHADSGRAFLSKGLLDQAKNTADANVRHFAPLLTAEKPLIGIEPSAILTFRDEYIRLASDKAAALELQDKVFLLEEFLVAEAKKGNITAADFSTKQRAIHLHGHCHQKALAGVDPTAFILSLPQNYTVQVIPSGCCGMAGSFGYEKDKYELSMQIGEMVLFPAVRKTSESCIIAAPGTSCRHQILDGTGRIARHPAEILLEALV